MQHLYEEYWVLADLLEVVEAAIKAGDWKVNEARNPGCTIARAVDIVGYKEAA